MDRDMVYVQGFESEDEPSVVVGVYVNDIIISNDGYAFIELPLTKARELVAAVTSHAVEVEGL